jgi:uncharacterized protein
LCHCERADSSGRQKKNDKEGETLLQYEIEYNSRKYFGNVALKEFHCFRCGDDFYLFSVEQMIPHKISESVYQSIEGLFISPGSLISEKMMAALSTLNLVGGEDDRPEGISGDSSPGKIIAPDKPGEEKTGKDPLGKSQWGVHNIALLVAQECNMRCAYCYGDGGSYGEQGGIMSEETAFKAVDWLMKNSKSSRQLHISFFGGEPLLNFPLIKKVVAYAREKAQEREVTVSFGITTNATLLTDEIISFMSRERINPMVSFDGPPEIQNRQRPFVDGSGSYDTVSANILKLLAAYPRLVARAIVFGDADPLEIEAGMREVGLTSCLIGQSSPVILATAQAGKTTPEEAENETIERMIALLRKAGVDLVRAVKSRRVEFNMVASLAKMLISRKKKYFGCGVGKGMAGISVSGDVYPCHRFVGQKDARMGSIESYTVGGLNDFHRADVYQLPGCRTCWARYFCAGGCFYDNKARTGDMHRAAKSYCETIKAATEVAISAYLQLDEDDKEFFQKMYDDRIDEKLP